MGPWLLMLVLGAAGSGRLLSDPYWVKLAGTPTEADLYCAGYDHTRQWAVAVEDGGPVVRPQRYTARADPLPFAVPKDQDRSGDRHVLQVPDGWLVGFDAGEFGGGLWFTDGKRWSRVRPAAEAPAAAGDPFKAENVRGLVSLEAGEILVLMGLDHLTGRSGRVFRVEAQAAGYSLAAGAVLDSSPEDWGVADGQLEVLTGGGLWRVASGAKAERALAIDFGTAYPSSMAAGPDGRRYVGMRRYVLVLEPSGRAWQQTWYAPSDCPRSRRDERWNCTCLK